jgi:hypothetical protein
VTPLAVCLAVNVLASGAMAGVIWAVQLAIYPRFAEVPAEAFVRYHRRYCTGIGWVVGPLMLAELTAGVTWIVLAPQSPAAWCAVGLTVVALGSTAVFQVPLHRRLAAGWDPVAGRRLVQTNWLRTAAWTARAVLVTVVAVLVPG